MDYKKTINLLENNIKVLNRTMFLEEKYKLLPKKYVLTGGPSSGKSSLIYNLELKDNHTINEVATKVILAYQAKGIEKPWEIKTFESRIYRLQKKLEDLFKDKTIFLDRSLIDVYVYAQMMEQWVPDELHQFVEDEKTCKKYDKIFYIEPLNSYKKEKYRRESQNEAQEMGERIQNFYKELGYETISVPDIGIENRLELILKNVK